MAERNVLGRGQESEDDLDTTELGRLNGGRQDEPSQGPRCIGFRQLLLTAGLASVTAVGVFALAKPRVGQHERPKPVLLGNPSKKTYAARTESLHLQAAQRFTSNAGW